MRATHTPGQPVDYYLSFAGEGDNSNDSASSDYHLNPFIGRTLHLKFHQLIQCQHCGRRTKKSFSQGYCYPCFKKLAQCDLCIMSPERCHYHAGTCRDSDWADQFCMQPHIVYLANASGLKVGITRPSQIPTRWIDQGAMQALPIMRVSSRRLSGLVEVLFKQYVSDKTQWQRMLKGDAETIDLSAERDRLVKEISPALEKLQGEFGIQALQPVLDAEPIEIQFPIDEYPTKVKSLNLDKTPTVSGVLKGIKAQYLILDTGVINLRKYTAYDVEFMVD